MQKTKQEIEKAMINVSYRIASDITTVYTVEQLATWAGITTTVLKREFKIAYGLGPFGYLHKLRMEQAKALLTEGHPGKEVCKMLGYNQYTNFIAAFRRYHGITPTVYRLGALGKANVGTVSE